MTIENTIKDVIATKLDDGTVEQLVAEHLEKGVKNALESLFRSYGDVTKVIEDQIKSVMIPYLERYDYSKYLVKLDSVLVDVLKNSSLDNKKLLENFKELMTTDKVEKEIKVTDLFDKWTKYVAKNVRTDDLEVEYDDEVRYQYVAAKFEVEYEEEKRWSSSIYEYANLTFECEEDEEMNFGLRLYRWKSDRNKAWDIEYKGNHDLNSLKHLNDMDIMIMKLAQNYTKINIDEDDGSDEVRPEKEPEASFS